MERPEEGVQDKLIQNDMQRVLLVLSLLITSVAQAQSIQVKNPLMWTDAPDPDIIRVGDYYYLVTTTMHLFPGGLS